MQDERNWDREDRRPTEQFNDLPSGNPGKNQNSALNVYGPKLIYIYVIQCPFHSDDGTIHLLNIQATGARGRRDLDSLYQ